MGSSRCVLVGPELLKCRPLLQWHLNSCAQRQAQGSPEVMSSASGIPRHLFLQIFELCSHLRHSANTDVVGGMIPCLFWTELQ